MISALDLKSNRWSSLGPAERDDCVAFVPVGAIWDRLVVLLDGRMHAYNPLRPQEGLNPNPNLDPHSL